MSRLHESKEADAVSHKKRRERNKTFGSLQKKFYLGEDVRNKMALINRKLAEKVLDPRRMDSELGSDILSAAVNQLYNLLFSEEEIHLNTSHSLPPKIEPPMSPRAFKKYRLYQQVRGRFDALETTGDRDKQKWKSVAEHLKKSGIEKPEIKSLSSMLSDGEWSSADVEAILNPERISRLIAKDNKRYKEQIAPLADTEKVETEN